MSTAARAAAGGFQPGDSVWIVADDTVYPARLYHCDRARCSGYLPNDRDTVSARVECVHRDQLPALEQLIDRRRQLLELVGHAARLRLEREISAAATAETFSA